MDEIEQVVEEKEKNSSPSVGRIQRKKGSTHTKLPQYPNMNARTIQLRFDVQVKVNNVTEEPEAKAAMVVKFKEVIGRMMDEEKTTVLYPYSTISSAVPIAARTQLTNTFTELKRHLQSLKPPLKNSDVVYKHIYIGRDTEYAD